MESVADFKNMKEANHKDTRITLTEAILVHFLSLTLNMFQFAGKFLEHQILKNNFIQTFRKFKANIRKTVVYIVKT